MRALALLVLLIPAVAAAEPVVMCDGTELPAGHTCAKTSKKGTWTCCEQSKAKGRGGGGDPRPAPAPVDMVEISPKQSLVAGGCRADEGCAGQPAYDLSVNAAFFLDRTEVTQAAFERCVKAGKCAAPACQYDPAAHGDHPAVCVTWTQARAFCAWRDARLPTEAQWEVAARGDDARPYPWGEEPPACHRANFKDCGGAPMRVGALDAGQSPFGVLDLAGNVEEWTADAARCQPGAGEACRAVRGGAYNHGAKGLTTFRRRVYPEDAPAATRGFRCARGESPSQTLVRRAPSEEESADKPVEKPAPVPVPQHRNRNRAILFTGTSVATLGLAGFFTWSAKSDWNDSKTECPDLDDCALRDTAKSQATLAAVFGVAGVAAGAAAIYFWIQDDDVPPVPTEAAQLAPIIGPDGLGVSWTASF